MVLDVLDKGNDGFNIPTRFNRAVVDLSEKSRTEELVFESKLEVPSSVEFFIQSNAPSVKFVKVISESEILGLNSRQVIFNVGEFTGSSSTSGTFILDAGKYSVYLSSEKTDGKIAIGYRETDKEVSEFERLLKVHKGDLNNPPDRYEKVYSTDLTGLSYKEEVIYKLTIDQAKEVGFSIYTSAEQGNISVDIIGESSNYFSTVHSNKRICDQLEATLPAGDYLVKLTCKNADGQLFIFLKR